MAKAEDCKSFIPGSSPGAASKRHVPTLPQRFKLEARNSKQIPMTEIPNSVFHYQDREPPDAEQSPCGRAEAVFGRLGHSDLELVLDFEIR